MEANEITNDETQQDTSIPQFEQELTQTEGAIDGSFEEALGLPYREEVAPVADTPKAGVETMRPPEGVPVVDNTQPIPQQAPNNEEVRFQYWQSEAAKLKSQLDGVQQYMPMVDYLRSNPEAVANIQAKPGPTPEEEGFPEAPVRPKQPNGFTREEAMNDPASDSAKHLSELEEWRDTMTQYNQLSSQYQVAKMQEVYDQKISDLQKVNLHRDNVVREEQAMQQAKHYVASNYDLGENLDGFITEMNDDASINMDDLVGYYKYKHGLANPNQAVQQTARPPNAPSRAFQQVQRAQSVPQPMGVIAGQGNVQKTTGDSLMDSLIFEDNTKNIL